jgi:hypothetical protein
MAIEVIRTAGSSGVEQAAMDMALRLSLRCEGSCRGGFRGIDNESIPEQYRKHLTQLASDEDVVMMRNVDEAHGVLVLFDTPITNHERAAKTYARMIGKPTVLCSMHEALRWDRQRVQQVRDDLKGARVVTVIGPTLHQRPEIYHQVCEFFQKMWS